MVKNHIKRLAAPKTWPINRKTGKWISKPNPGTHTLDSCMALGTVLTEILELCKNAREVKYILSKNEVKVDGITRKDKKFPIGLMDILTVMDNSYRILFNTKGKLISLPISKEESKIKLKRIVGKTTLKGNKFQINLFDGTNFISDKKNIKTYDTLVFSEGKLKEKLEFKEGSFIYIFKGKQKGKTGVLKTVEKGNNLQPRRIIFSDGKTDHETLKDYVFVIGNTKPIISLSNE